MIAQTMRVAESRSNIKSRSNLDRKDTSKSNSPLIKAPVTIEFLDDKDKSEPSSK
jgi:hypothetical protein